MLAVTESPPSEEELSQFCDYCNYFNLIIKDEILKVRTVYS